MLVHRLTGIDPDRLQEEKERGMTIDLGFAWLKLPGGKDVGIIDVPGHERFIKNMLAGVSSIDLVLLIVAANEGLMPQTREHLAILDLLGIKRGIVVITKKDIVDEDQVNFVKLEIQELIASSSLEKAPVISVSAVTGEGLPELLENIDSLLNSTEPRKDTGKPRLFIDRVFTIAGSGTVVTGTLVDGSLSVGQEVEIVPSGIKTRLRGLQTHKVGINKAYAGSRVAVNLTGISTSQIKRGEVLTTPGWLASTSTINVHLSVLPYLHYSLRNNFVVSFHSGTSQTMAKIRLLDRDELKAGESSWAQLSLRDPLALVKGDRFVIRSSSDTVAGGEIIETQSKRYRRSDKDLITKLQSVKEGTIEKAITTLVQMKQPLELADLAIKLNLSADSFAAVLETLIQEKELVKVGQGERCILYTWQGWEELVKHAFNIVQEFHEKFPARPGMPKAELATKLKLSPHSISFQDISKRILIEEETLVRLPTHETQITASQKAVLDAFLDSLAKSPYAPPDDKIPDADLLNLLIKQGSVVRVNNNIVFLSTVYNAMVERIVSHIKTHGKVTLSEVRDMFGTSRKYAQALLEHMDQQKITRRVEDEHVLRHQI
jgi:selenocysteine-specific elongation factor